jgi:hypothetical protein
VLLSLHVVLHPSNNMIILLWLASLLGKIHPFHCLCLYHETFCCGEWLVLVLYQWFIAYFWLPALCRFLPCQLFKFGNKPYLMKYTIMVLFHLDTPVIGYHIPLWSNLWLDNTKSYTMTIFNFLLYQNFQLGCYTWKSFWRNPLMLPWSLN